MKPFTLLRLLGAFSLIALATTTGTGVPVLAQGDVNQVVPVNAYKDLKYRSVGATRGGRVTAFSGVRQQPYTFYFGGVGGGVWKTDDAGINWTPISDGQIATGSIGSIDVAPSNPNHVWVGTGSAAIRSNVIIGRGVYKSLDAGKTWQFMGLKDTGQIGAIKVHPFNTNIVWLAALGSPFGANEDRGIYKTVDAGKTWKKTLFVNNETGGRDVEVDYDNPDIVYAAMYKGIRKGWDIVSGGPATEGGIFKSTDGGETWKHMTNGLPKDLIGKIDIDIARSNSKVVYAMIEALGDLGGLYRSNDAGETWALVNNSQRLRARPFYFHYVNVNPKNENDVYVSELGLHHSLDGGKTFTDLADPHGDDHGVWINPDNPQILLQVSDGRCGGEPERRQELVDAAEPAHRRVLHGGDGRTVSLSDVRAAAGQHHAHHSQQPTRVVGLRPSVASVAAGFRLRDRTDLAEARWQGGVGCLQGRSGPLQRGHGPGKALLGLSAKSLRPRSGRHQVPLSASDRRLRLAARLARDLPGLACAASLDR